jgi:GNAT superfamily N-acetyltransferase
VSDLHLLVDRWLEGWAVSRGATLTRRTEMVDVDLGPDSRSRRRELVMVEPPASVLHAALTEVAMTDDLWATVFGEHPRVGHPGAPVQDDDEALMTAALPRDAGAPNGVELEVDGLRAFARISVDGEHAAEGQVGLAGEHAVFDRIRTHDGFERRGLGSRVVQALTAWSVERGATAGVLVASAQGQLLYARLGWTRRAPLTTWAALQQRDR